jgi:two-component sensor histidine kinase
MQGENAVDVTIDTCEVPSEMDTAIPFGLMLNELLTNAWKHAFGDAKGSTLHISLVSHEGEVTLEVGDDGPGLPAGFSITETSSLGLRLAEALASQLRGELFYDSSGHGTTFRVVFPQYRSSRS